MNVFGSDAFAHRRGRVEVTLRDAAGVALSGAEVTVRQVRHDFQFGCTSVGLDRDEQTRELWLDLFDTATLAEFYWGRYEPVPGEVEKERVEKLARWYADRGVRLKGHPLVWHTVKAAWLDALPIDDAAELIRRRVRREVTEYAGLVDAWDVINEVVIMPRFTNEPDGIPNAVSRVAAQLGRVEMVRLAVDEARSQGTRPFLLLNDFDLGVEYEHLIEQVLDAGIQIDAIGLQSHMHKGFRGEEQLLDMCDRFARFGLPLHWTETTILSGELVPQEVVDLNDVHRAVWPSTPDGEARQADEIEHHYRALVSHPAVQSITYWGMEDARAWLGAPAGLLRVDGSPKPAYHALRDLVRGEWWVAEHVVRSSASGAIEIEGFAGTYEVAVAGQRAAVDIAAGQHELVVQLG